MPPPPSSRRELPAPTPLVLPSHLKAASGKQVAGHVNATLGRAVPPHTARKAPPPPSQRRRAAALRSQEGKDVPQQAPPLSGRAVEGRAERPEADSTRQIGPAPADQARHIDARWAADLAVPSEAPQNPPLAAPTPEAAPLGVLADDPPTLPNNLPLMNVDREISALRPRPSELTVEASPGAESPPKYRGRTPSELSALYQALPSTDAPPPPKQSAAPARAGRGHLPKAPYEILPPPPPPSKRHVHVRPVAAEEDDIPTQTKTPTTLGALPNGGAPLVGTAFPTRGANAISPLPPPAALPPPRLPAPPLLPTGMGPVADWEPSEWTDARHADPLAASALGEPPSSPRGVHERGALHQVAQQPSPQAAASYGAAFTTVRGGSEAALIGGSQDSLMPAASSIAAPSHRGRHSGPRGWVAVAGASVLGAALSAGAFLLPARGQLLVDVTNQGFTALTDAQVYVNDELVCSQSPCAVKVEATTQHVRVAAPGYQPSPQEPVVVTEGVVTLHKVQLGASADTGIDVQTNVPDLQLYIDGRRIGGLPRKVMGLSPGEHTVLVSGGDHYTTEERHIRLEPNQTLLIDDLQPKLRSASLELTVGQNALGAHVTLDGQNVSLPLQTTLKAGHRYVLEANRPGYQTLSRIIEVDPSRPALIIPVDLEPAAIVSPRSGSSESARWTRSHRGADKGYEDQGGTPKVAAHEENEGAAASPVASDPIGDSALGAAMRQSVGLPAEPPKGERKSGATSSGNGFLNVVTTPSAVVLLDGKPVGKTPQRLSVSPGTHSIVLIHEGGRKRTSVNVEAGAQKTIKASF